MRTGDHDTGNNRTGNVDFLADPVYRSDYFRMFSYKIKRCPFTKSHDWMLCPYAHRGEKAQRRDPRNFHYSAISCSNFRAGNCGEGESCQLAHGVFEYWLHPARYRTRLCNAGRYCRRKVCFFAHTPEQLRSETKYKCHFFYPPIRCAGKDGGGEIISVSSPVDDRNSRYKESEIQNITWISDLVK